MFLKYLLFIFVCNFCYTTVFCVDVSCNTNAFSTIQKLYLKNHNKPEKSIFYDLVVDDNENFIIAAKNVIKKYNNKGNLINKYIVNELLPQNMWLATGQKDTIFYINQIDNCIIELIENQKISINIEEQKKEMEYIQPQLKYIHNSLFFITSIIDNDDCKLTLNKFNLKEKDMTKYNLPILELGESKFNDFRFDGNYLSPLPNWENSFFDFKNKSFFLLNDSMISQSRDYITTIADTMFYLGFKLCANNEDIKCLLYAINVKSKQVIKQMELDYSIEANFSNSLMSKQDDWDQKSPYWIKNKSFLPFYYNAFRKTVYFLVNDKSGNFIWKIELEKL